MKRVLLLFLIALFIIMGGYCLKSEDVIQFRMKNDKLQYQPIVYTVGTGKKKYGCLAIVFDKCSFTQQKQEIIEESEENKDNESLDDIHKDGSKPQCDNKEKNEHIHTDECYSYVIDQEAINDIGHWENVYHQPEVSLVDIYEEYVVCSFSFSDGFNCQKSWKRKTYNHQAADYLAEYEDDHEGVVGSYTFKIERVRVGSEEQIIREGYYSREWIIDIKGQSEIGHYELVCGF